MTISKNTFKQIAITAAMAGDAKKASPVRVYDLGGKSTLADYAVLMEVESAPQLDAVEEEVSIRLKHEGFYCLHKEGQNSKNWKVLDYGGVLVHVYEKKSEEYYSISKVYADYKPVEWEQKPAPAPVRKPVEAPAEEQAAVKPAAKKAAAKKPAKKAPVKKAAVKKAAKKTAVKKAAAKKPAAKKAVKKSVKKAAVKKISRKAPVKKAAAKKAVLKKKAVKKAPARKAAKVKKAKPAAKKASKKKK